MTSSTASQRVTSPEPRSTCRTRPETIDRPSTTTALVPSGLRRGRASCQGVASGVRVEPSRTSTAAGPVVAAGRGVGGDHGEGRLAAEPVRLPDGERAERDGLGAGLAGTGQDEAAQPGSGDVHERVLGCGDPQAQVHAVPVAARVGDAGEDPTVRSDGEVLVALERLRPEDLARLRVEFLDASFRGGDEPWGAGDPAEQRVVRPGEGSGTPGGVEDVDRLAVAGGHREGELPAVGGDVHREADGGQRLVCRAGVRGHFGATWVAQGAMKKYGPYPFAVTLGPNAVADRPHQSGW